MPKFLITLLFLTLISNAAAELNTRIDAGYWHLLYLDGEDNVVAAGTRQYGQTGPYAPLDGYYGMAPVHVGIKAKSVDAGMHGSAALRHDGTVMYWGWRVTESSPEPAMLAGITNAVDVAVGVWDVFIVTSDGTLYEYKLETGSLTPLSIPEEVVEVSANNYFAMARTKLGKVYAWGSNTDGQLCDGTIISRDVPVLTKFPLSSGITAGLYTAFSLNADDGSISVCGRMSDGVNDSVFVAGDPNVVGTQTSPVSVPGLSGMIDVVAARSGGMAINTEGTVYAWGWHNLIGVSGCGYNYSGVCEVSVLNDTAFIGAGNDSLHAIDTAGNIFGWMGNHNGMLGNGDNVEQHGPVQALSPTGAEHIEALICEIDSDAINDARTAGYSEGFQAGAQSVQPEVVTVEVPVEVIKEVEVPIEVIREVTVPVEVIREVEVVREVEVIKEIPVPEYIEVPTEVEVVKTEYVDRVPPEMESELARLRDHVQELEARLSNGADHDNGHGNDSDKIDESNPGKSKAKPEREKISSEESTLRLAKPVRRISSISNTGDMYE